MKLCLLRIRYINYAGYEIELPDHRVIALDPCLTTDGVQPSDDYYGRVDYILISHTHYDHTKDIPVILKKNHPEILCPGHSAFNLAEDFNLDLDHLYPLYPDQSLFFENLRITARFAKHKAATYQRTISCERENLQKAFGAQYLGSNICGSAEYIDYEITLAGGLKIFISGGGIVHSLQNINAELLKYKPNILFRQTTSKYSPEEFAELLKEWGAVWNFPLHQDGLEKASGMSLAEYFIRTNSYLEKMEISCRAINPIPGRWYEISTRIE